MYTYIGLADLDAEIELGGHISSRNAIGAGLRFRQRLDAAPA
jgi:hypothetical protein